MSHDASAHYEDRLHAIRSGLAAVSGAVQALAVTSADPANATRRRLEAMLLEEVERLQRLASADLPSPPAMRVHEELDLDEVVASVVGNRRLAGHEVAWTRSGHRAVGNRDAVVEVLNILTVNSWRHGAGALTRIDVVQQGATVRVSVIDDGPGVPEELRDAIFERGVRRKGSSGQGLGLAMARELARDLGGWLELRSSGERGTSFDLTLPVAAALDGAA